MEKKEKKWWTKALLLRNGKELLEFKLSVIAENQEEAESKMRRIIKEEYEEGFYLNADDVPRLIETI